MFVAVAPAQCLPANTQKQGKTADLIRRPRRGSNAQPPDSKSVTLSIELRGRASEIILENEIIIKFWPRTRAFKCCREGISEKSAIVLTIHKVALILSLSL